MRWLIFVGFEEGLGFIVCDRARPGRFAEEIATDDGKVIVFSRSLISRSNEYGNESKHKAHRIEVGQKEWLCVRVVGEDTLRDCQLRIGYGRR